MIPDLDGAARGLLLQLFDLSLRALAIAAIAALIILLLRLRRPAARLAGWTVVLYGALALPAAGVALGAVGLAMPVPVPTLAPPAPVETAAVPSAVFVESAGVGDVAAPAPEPWPWTAIAAGLYLFGALMLFARLGIGWRLTRGLARDARAIDDDRATARLRELAAVRGITQPPQLVESDRLLVPVTMGVARQAIALPADWRAWDAATLDAVLAHEIAHAARRDALTQHVSLLYRALTWPSPLGWWLHRHLAELAEQSSDEAALEAGVDRTTYARMLVDFFARVRQEPRRAEWHVAMARRAGAGAERRVDRILNWKGESAMKSTRMSLLIVAVAAVPVVALTAALQPAPPQAPVSVSVETVPEITPVAAPVAIAESVVPVRAEQRVPTASVETSAPVGRSTVIATEFDIERISNTDREIADVLVVEPRRILVNGHRAGTTAIWVWGPGQRIKYEVSIAESGQMTVRQPPSPPTAVVQRPQTISGVALGIAAPRDGAPVAIVQVTSTVADGAYASMVVRNDGTKPVRSIVVAATVRATGNSTAKQSVFRSPALVTWIPAGSSQVLEPRLIDPATLSRLGSVGPNGATAVLDIVRVEFGDGSAWTPSGTPQTQSRAQVPAPPVAQTDDEFLAGAYRAGPQAPAGLVNPISVARVHPKYTSDAMRAKIQGFVEVEAVIERDGTVDRVRVTKSLDQMFGLDEQALAAARQWRFTPAMLNGEAVPVVVILQLEFKLH